MGFYIPIVGTARAWSARLVVADVGFTFLSLTGQLTAQGKKDERGGGGHRCFLRLKTGGIKGTASAREVLHSIALILHLFIPPPPFIEPSPSRLIYTYDIYMPLIAPPRVGAPSVLLHRKM